MPRRTVVCLGIIGIGILVGGGCFALPHDVHVGCLGGTIGATLPVFYLMLMIIVKESTPMQSADAMIPYIALCLDIPRNGRVIGMIAAGEDELCLDDAEIAQMLRAVVAPIMVLYRTFSPEAVAVALYESGRWKYEYRMPCMAARVPDWRVCHAAIVIEESGEGIIRRRARVTRFRLWD